MLNAHDAHLPSFSLYENALMPMRGADRRREYEVSTLAKMVETSVQVGCTPEVGLVRLRSHVRTSRGNRQPLKRINRGAFFIRDSITSSGVLPRPSVAKSQVRQIQASPAMTQCRSASAPPDCE